MKNDLTLFVIQLKNMISHLFKPLLALGITEKTF